MQKNKQKRKLRLLSKGRRCRPWINNDGSKKSDAEISLLGRYWNQKTWSAFLDEDVGRVVGHFLTLTEETRPNDRERRDEYLTDKFATIDLEEVFQTALESLSFYEEGIIKKLFLEEASARDTAAYFGVSPSQVRKIKSRALGKLRRILQEDSFAKKLLKKLASEQPLSHTKRNVFEEGRGPYKGLSFLRENFPELTYQEQRLAYELFLTDTGTPCISRELGLTLIETLELKEKICSKLRRIYQEGYEANKQRSAEKKGYPRLRLIL